MMATIKKQNPASGRKYAQTGFLTTEGEWL